MGTYEHDPNAVDDAIRADVDLQAELADDRGRGMLTKTDREFLAGEADKPGAQQKRNRRYKIRQRVVNGIKDGIFLLEQTKKDRKQIFEKFSGENWNYLLEFGVYIYRGLDDGGIEKRELHVEVIEEAEKRKGNDVDVEITSTVGGQDDKEVTMKLHPRNDEMTNANERDQPPV